MCLQFPGKVIKIENNIATVDYDIEKRKATIADIRCNVGDYVIILGKFIVDVVPEKNAIEALKHWKKIMND